VPYLAVLNPSDGVGTVFVVENNVAHQRKVQLGFVTPDKIEIRSGVSAGEPVVTQGQMQLQDGMKVQIESPNTTSSVSE
jgi:HlyD family secretion protein